MPLSSRFKLMEIKRVTFVVRIGLTHMVVNIRVIHIVM